MAEKKDANMQKIIEYSDYIYQLSTERYHGNFLDRNIFRKIWSELSVAYENVLPENKNKTLLILNGYQKQLDYAVGDSDIEPSNLFAAD